MKNNVIFLADWQVLLSPLNSDDYRTLIENIINYQTRKKKDCTTPNESVNYAWTLIRTMIDSILEGKKEIKKEDKSTLVFANGYEELWNVWKDYKKKQFNFTYKHKAAEQLALDKFQKLSKMNLTLAKEYLLGSISRGYKGIFPVVYNEPENKPSNFSL